MKPEMAQYVAQITLMALFKIYLFYPYLSKISSYFKQFGVHVGL